MKEVDPKQTDLTNTVKKTNRDLQLLLLYGTTAAYTASFAGFTTNIQTKKKVGKTCFLKMQAYVGSYVWRRNQENAIPFNGLPDLDLMMSLNSLCPPPGPSSWLETWAMLTG